MNASSQSRVVIIAAVDETPASEHVVHSATALASQIAGAEVHFLHVVDFPVVAQQAYVSPLADLLRAARSFVDGLTRAATGRFSGRISGHVAVGSPSKEILQLAVDLEADVVIVGAHGKGALERLLQGSVSRAIAAAAPCAVLVARPKDYASVPDIAPACPGCLAIQRASQGDTLWCAQHATQHAHGQLHYEMPEGFGAGAMFVRP